MPPGALEDVDCPQCGADEPLPWAEENGFSALRCGKCATVYVSPRPAADSISRAAVTGMHEGDRLLDETARYDAAKIGRTRDVLATLYGERFFTGRAVRWLDVGCGYGELLESVAELAAGGSTLVGCEPNEHKASAARARGLDVRFFDLEGDDGGERFEFISLVDVYSHLPDPRAFLGALARRLEPRGELLLATGNFAELERDEISEPLFLPDHLSFSSEPLLRELLGEIGFEVQGCLRRRPYHLEPSLANRLRQRLRRWRRPELPEPDWQSPCRELWFRARLADGRPS